MSSNTNDVIRTPEEAANTDDSHLEPSIGDYKRISTDEFEETLDSIQCPSGVDGWEIIDAAGYETTYAFNIVDTDVEIRIISTLENGQARDRGEDSIKTMLYHQRAEKIIEYKPRTNRQYGYESNLIPKVEDLMDNWRAYWRGFCPECDYGTLKEKNGKYGLFIACDNYPNCEHSVSL